MSLPKHLKSHAVLLPGGCVVAICLTKSIAESFAKAAYPGGSYLIVVAEKRHYKEIYQE